MDTIHLRAIPALLLVMAVLLVVTAAAAPADTGTADHHIAIRQAHLAWVAQKTDLEMDTALVYVGTRYNTDTTKMTTLLTQFRNDEAQIPLALTDASLNLLISDMQKTTRTFRDETAAQMSAGLGSQTDLSGKIRLVTANNPYIEEKKNRFWDLRKSGQLSDFDTWAAGAQAELNALSAQGYDTAQAQRALDVTVAKRPELAAALDTKDEETIQAAYTAILALSKEYAARAGEVGQQVPDDSRLWFLMEQADRAVSKADRLNQEIVVVTLDLGSADPALSRLKTDITTTKRLLNSGKLVAAKKNLPVVQKDLSDLAEGYRELVRGGSLPADLSGSLSAMAIALDNTAAQMGGA